MSIIIKSHFYDYQVNFVENFRDTLKSDNAFFIIDENVKKEYDSIEKIEPKILINANEEAKSLYSISNIIETLLLYPLNKNSVLVAIGGGVIQDITSFISSILFRGIRWYFYPTTLLAQADSCIGSKSSINIAGKKNQVGTFHPPSRIFIDIHFLDTISPQTYYSGIGEMIKMGFLTDRGYWARNITDSIKQALLSKKKFIEKDEFDKHERNLLNYGHTFGHAIEGGTGYKIPHGIAVIMGMDIENYISLRKQYMKEQEFRDMYSRLEDYYPTIKFNYDEKKAILENIAFDKKNLSLTEISLILSKGQGKMFKTSLPCKEIENYFEEYCELRDLTL